MRSKGRRLSRALGIVCLAVSVVLSGCGPTLMAAGAAGYAFGTGTVRGRVNMPAELLFGRCVVLANSVGEDVEADPQKRTVRFREYAAYVTISVRGADDGSPPVLKVSARNEQHVAEPDLAKSVFDRIAGEWAVTEK